MRFLNTEEANLKFIDTDKFKKELITIESAMFDLEYNYGCLKIEEIFLNSIKKFKKKDAVLFTIKIATNEEEAISFYNMITGLFVDAMVNKDKVRVDLNTTYFQHDNPINYNIFLTLINVKKLVTYQSKITNFLVEIIDENDKRIELIIEQGDKKDD